MVLRVIYSHRQLDDPIADKYLQLNQIKLNIFGDGRRDLRLFP